MPRRARSRGPARAGDRVPFESMLRPLRHEVNNVLSPIVTVADLLTLRGGGPEVGLLVTGIRQLVLMLDDVWTLTRTMAGELDVAARTVELDEVIARVVRATAPRLEQVGAQLELAVSPGQRVKADLACLVLALASIVHHAASPAARLTLDAIRDATTIIVRVRAGSSPLPAERALLFARQLLGLMGGSVVAGDGLQVSLPAAD